MSQTILIEPNSDLRDLYSLNLANMLSTNIIIRKNAEEAVSLLAILPTINLIIVRSKVGTENTAFILSEYLKEHELDIPLIILGDDTDLGSLFTVLVDPVNIHDLLSSASKLLGFDDSIYLNKTIPDYFPIEAKYFFNITETPCDVYIRIKKSPSEFQYVKRIHVKDTFNRIDIEKYIAQGLKEFYVPKDYRINFTKFVSNSIIKKLERKDLNNDERFLTNAETYDFLRDYIHSFGLDDTAIELTDATISSINQNVKADPQLSTFLESLKKNKVSYAYQHCHLMALLSYNILKQLDWGTPDLFDKMCYVAFFHDLSLTNDDMMLIGSNAELESSDLTPEHKTEVNEHARRSSNMIARHAEAPFGADIIILQHHGMMDGVGFAEDFQNPLAPLSMIVIVIEEFINEVFIQKKALSLKEVFNRMKSKFEKTSYISIIEGLEKSLTQKVNANSNHS
ncbi:MAG: hypothetical protein ACOYL6_07105 [Bacteriovoracaceae bacterium]